MSSLYAGKKDKGLCEIIVLYESLSQQLVLCWLYKW